MTYTLTVTSGVSALTNVFNVNRRPGNSGSPFTLHHTTLNILHVVIRGGLGLSLRALARRTIHLCNSGLAGTGIISSIVSFVLNHFHT